jgi:hypothetical protein
LIVACVSGGKPGSACETSQDCQRGMVCDKRFPSDTTKVCLVDLGGPSFRLVPQSSSAKPVSTSSGGPACGGVPPPLASPAGVDCEFTRRLVEVTEGTEVTNPVITERALIYTRWIGGTRDKPLEVARFQPLSDDGELAGNPVAVGLDWVGRAAVKPFGKGYLVVGGRRNEAVLVELDARGHERRRIALGQAASSGDAALTIHGDRALVSWSIALREVWATWVFLEDFTRADAFRIAEDSHAPRALAAPDGFHVAWATLVDRATRYSTARIVAKDPPDAALFDVRSGTGFGREPSSPVGFLRVDDSACPVVRVGAVHTRLYLDCGTPKLIGQVAIVGFSGAVAQTSSAGALAYTREGIRLQWLNRSGDRIGDPLLLGESVNDTAPSLFGTPNRLWTAWQRVNPGRLPDSVFVRTATCR